jgi:hypothetical protein
MMSNALVTLANLGDNGIEIWELEAGEEGRGGIGRRGKPIESADVSFSLYSLSFSLYPFPTTQSGISHVEAIERQSFSKRTSAWSQVAIGDRSYLDCHPSANTSTRGGQALGVLAGLALSLGWLLIEFAMLKFQQPRRRNSQSVELDPASNSSPKFTDSSDFKLPSAKSKIQTGLNRFNLIILIIAFLVLLTTVSSEARFQWVKYRVLNADS